MTDARTWLRAGGGWLVICAGFSATMLIRHAFFGVGVAGQHQLTVQAMQQTLLLQPLGPSFWTMYVAMGLTASLMIAFAGVCSWGVGGLSDPVARRRYALFATIFWTIVFAVVAMNAPLPHPLVTALGAVPPHAIAALLDLEEEVASEAPAASG